MITPLSLLDKEAIVLNIDFVRERITQLRMLKGVSEYKMSYDLGHSRGYINNITSGKSLPSLAELFAICDYFDISPVEFFDGISNPKLFNATVSEIEKLDDTDLELIHTLVKRLLENPS